MEPASVFVPKVPVETVKGHTLTSSRHWVFGVQFLVIGMTAGIPNLTCRAKLTFSLPFFEAPNPQNRFRLIARFSTQLI